MKDSDSEGAKVLQDPEREQNQGCYSPARAGPKDWWWVNERTHVPSLSIWMAEGLSIAIMRSWTNENGNRNGNGNGIMRQVTHGKDDHSRTGKWHNYAEPIGVLYSAWEQS